MGLGQDTGIDIFGAFSTALLAVTIMRCLAALLLSVFCLAASAGQNRSQPVITIQGATVVAFFNVTQKEVDEDEGLAEGLTDFQIYTERAAERLKDNHISVYQRYGNSFKVKVGGKTKTINVPKGEHGYYYFAPSRRANVEYGVSTDVEIVQTAEKYFGLKK